MRAKRTYAKTAPEPISCETRPLTQTSAQLFSLPIPSRISHSSPHSDHMGRHNKEQQQCRSKKPALRSPRAQSRLLDPPIVADANCKEALPSEPSIGRDTTMRAEEGPQSRVDDAAPSNDYKEMPVTDASASESELPIVATSSL
eukprot:scaffold4030_cov33-Tisochrysis_lutea.AAC.2